MSLLTTSIWPRLVAVFTLIGVASWVTPVDAYVDPGSGSMFVQLLLGGAAGMVVAVRVYWRRAVARFRSGRPAEADARKP